MARDTIKQKAETEDLTLLLHQSTKDIIQDVASRYHIKNTTTIINLTLSNTLNQQITSLQLPKYMTGDTASKLHIQVSPEVKQKIKKEASAFGITDSRFTETLLNYVLSQV